MLQITRSGPMTTSRTDPNVEEIQNDEKSLLTDYMKDKRRNEDEETK
jgi:hypothetical protein